MCVFMTYIYFLALSTERPGNNDAPVAMNTLCTQILVYKYHSPVKGSRAPWRSG